MRSCVGRVEIFSEGVCFNLTSNRVEKIISNAPPYPDDIDCAWLALDRLGNVGLFLNGGASPIPVSVLVGDGMPYDAIEKIIGGLPKISNAVAMAGYESSDVFLKFAEKGFFCIRLDGCPSVSELLHQLIREGCNAMRPACEAAVAGRRVSDGTSG